MGTFLRSGMKEKGNSFDLYSTMTCDRSSLDRTGYTNTLVSSKSEVTNLRQTLCKGVRSYLPEFTYFYRDWIVVRDLDMRIPRRSTALKMNANKIAVDHDMVCCGWNLAHGLREARNGADLMGLDVEKIRGELRRELRIIFLSLRIRG